MRLISAAQIMQQARSWTSTEGSNEPPDTDLLGFLNQSFTRFGDRLADATESDWFFNQYTFVTQQNVNSYPLPFDHNRLRFADSLVLPAGAGQAQRWLRLKRMDEALLNMPGTFFSLQVPAGQTIRLSYTPILPMLSQYAYLTLTAPDGVNQIILTASISGTWGLGVSVIVASGASLGVTASGMVVTITLPSSGGVTGSQIVNAVNTSVPQILTAADAFGAESWAGLLVGQTNLGGTLQFDFVNGWERFLVADCAAMIMRRLQQDDGPFQAEKLRLESEILALAAKRDSGEPQVAKDVMSERWMSYGPMLAVFPQRFGYRIFGQNPANPGPGNFFLVPTVAA